MNPYAVSGYLRELVLEPAAHRADLDWRDDALCAGTDSEQWYPEKGEAVRPAKLICRRCPSRVPCLGFALDMQDPYGIWGGLSREERRPARAARCRGTSLEDILAAADAAWDAVQEKASERRREAGLLGAAASARSRQAARELEASTTPQPREKAA